MSAKMYTICRVLRKICSVATVLQTFQGWHDLFHTFSVVINYITLYIIQIIQLNFSSKLHNAVINV